MEAWAPKMTGKPEDITLNILLVGEVGVGKTSFLLQLQELTKSADTSSPAALPNVPQTEEISTVHLSFRNQSVNVSCSLHDGPGLGFSDSVEDDVTSILGEARGRVASLLEAGGVRCS